MYIRSNEGRSDLDVDLGHETFTRENESDGRRGRLLSHKMLSSKYRGTKRSGGDWGVAHHYFGEALLKVFEVASASFIQPLGDRDAIQEVSNGVTRLPKSR